MNEKNNCTYFLAANSGEGFVSLFNELYDPRDGWKLYVIKGGPGTGKSGLIKKICQKADEQGLYYHRIICSSDPDSLDGAIIPELKTAICDGTSPHVMEPMFPGVSETIINLGDCWSDSSLKSDAQHIITLTDCNKELHRKSTHYLSAAASAAKANEKILYACVNSDKIDNYVVRTMSKITDSDSESKVTKIFLNGNTPKGKITLFDTAVTMCENIISITDEYCCIAPHVMGKLASSAQSKGKNIIVGLNPLRPSSSPLHLIIPEDNIGFFTSNSESNFKLYANKNINAMRFIDKVKFSMYKNKISFNKKASDSFNEEAISIIKKAKSVHDELEKYYIKAMDFEKLNSVIDNLIVKIFEC